MSASPERIRHLRDLFRRMWAEGTGQSTAPSKASLQIVLGVCGVEGWGNWTGDMAGSNNFGGLQVPMSMQPGGDGVTYTGVEHTDTHLDGTVYSTYFKFFLDGGGRTAEENGAVAFLHELTRRGKGKVTAAIRAGSAYDTAKAMHDTGYYEGFPPDPVENYTNGIVKNATVAAEALGEPVLVSVGGNKKKIVIALGAALVVAWAAGWLE